jgi:hypothetical protein
MLTEMLKSVKKQTIKIKIHINTVPEKKEKCGGKYQA